MALIKNSTHLSITHLKTTPPLPKMFKKPEIQTYTLSDSTSSHSKIASFIESATSLDSPLQYDICSKHQDKKGDYFEPEYPWVKYCEACALNLALCGKKIEKSLSSEQMINKIKLCDSLNQISQAIKSSEQAHDEYSFLSAELQLSRSWFSSILGQVDLMISQLTDIRNQLEEKIQQSINREIKDVFERQSLIVSKKIQLINEKSKIQCGFVQLIGKENQEEIIGTMNQAKLLVSQAENLITTEEYKIKLSESIRSVESLFEQKLTEIRQLEINFVQNEPKSLNETTRMSIAFGSKIMNYRGSKTEQTMSEDLTYEQGKRLLTACSTVQHSGLVTPCELLNNNENNPLGELSQNRKMSRAALQLKARCRSKSSQRKLEVNVRQNIENVVKKKLL